MTTSSTASAAPSFSLRRILLRTLVAAVALYLVIYAGDFLWLQLRAHYPVVGPTTGSVHRIRLLAIPLKNNKVEYQIDAQKPEEDLPCVRSLFPHAGIRPCWYVTRHAKDPIPM